MPAPDSFRWVSGQREFGRYFPNGVAVAVVVVIASARIAFSATTAVTRFRFRPRTTLPITFPMARTAPPEALSVPFFSALRDFGRPNTPRSPVPSRVAFSRPFTIRPLREFAKTVPEVPEEAAYIDGTSRTRFSAADPFPPGAPVSATTGAFFSLPARNDFLFAHSSVVSGISQPAPPMAPPVFFVLVQRRPVPAPGGAVKD
ncbi:carbohydrate ABC transporter permease [Streptomyces sp. NPDC018964]|uniref:carbohydrate ABC transporter permease n=1 Tax=Streptomyces sp. NPDC018964 TaxID=3365058 RepID=UPI0037AD9B32